MRNTKSLVLAVLALLFLGMGPTHAQQQISYLRGHNLYGNHCIECHESVVHIRDNRKAKSTEEIEALIIHWSSYRNLGWNQEDINDVLHYLNTRYYKY
ncbi:MAG: hypothetical protein OES09_05890 [Gammaproteobacteria bacterium]|nr:hypothetical protein [Gammaproteobacteria bacterium]